MTTIAWDGVSMAADTQGEFCGTRFRSVKIMRLRDGSLVGAAGASSVFAQMARWIEDGAHAGQRPGPQSDEETSVHLLHVDMDRNVRLHTRAGWQPVHEPFCAVGSGAPFALGAMARGANAFEAVEIAIRFDTSSGGDVMILHLPGGGSCLPVSGS